MTELIHMGHGQMVDVVQTGHETWELVFSEAGVPEYKAPPLAEVEADLIDIYGKSWPLEISAGSSVSSVKASGHIHDAYRIRIRVVHGNHFHTREGLLKDAPAVAPVPGPNGGALASFDGGLAVEVKPVDAETWELFFLKDGATVEPLAAETVTVQAVGPRAEDYQIRNLKTEASPSGKSLLATGKIKDGVNAYIVLAGTARNVPILAA